MNEITKVAERVYEETNNLKTPPIEVAEIDIDFFNNIVPDSYNLLGVGGSRIVYEKNGNVIKFKNGFDNDVGTRGQMKKEIDIWEKAEDKQKEYLLNIVDYDEFEYKWLKSDQVLPEEGIIYRVDFDLKRDILNELEENGIIFREGLETNVYYKHGDIILLDYGYNVELI